MSFSFQISSKAMKALAKDAEKRMLANNSNSNKPAATVKTGPLKQTADPEDVNVSMVSSSKRKEKVVKKKDNFKSKFEGQIVKALESYRELLEVLKKGERVENESLKGTKSHEKPKMEDEQELLADVSIGSKKRLSSSEVVAEVIKLDKLPEEEQESAVNELEMNMDLSDFNLESEWTIEMTEEAHKWFRKNKKRRNDYCQRVICRLKLLGTGRWPYGLCKPMQTKKSKAKLYESKIDTGNRIIWEIGKA